VQFLIFISTKLFSSRKWWFYGVHSLLAVGYYSHDDDYQGGCGPQTLKKVKSGSAQLQGRAITLHTTKLPLIKYLVQNQHTSFIIPFLYFIIDVNMWSGNIGKYYTNDEL
jgi:hypothetical protein